MNRRNQGQQGQSRRLSQSSQPLKGSRFNSQNFDDQNYEGKSLRASNERGNYSGMMNASQWDDDADTGYMGSSDYRDTDYDLDGSTYGSQRSSREMNSYGDYETNDRNRQPSRHSSLDDDRQSSRSRSFDRSFSSERDFSNRGTERQGSSSERFGYPSTMNSWAHSDRSTSGYDRDMNRGQSRWAGSNERSFGSSERPWSTGERFSSDRDMSRSQSYGQSYGEGSLDHDSESRFGSSQASGFFGKGPKGYRRSDDRIKEEVCETLARNPRIDASDIEVKVEEACVTLSGTVESKEIKRAAEMAIENLSGVDDVKNELRVKRADDSMFASSSGAKNTTTSTTGSKSTTSSSKGSSHL